MICTLTNKLNHYDYLSGAAHILASVARSYSRLQCLAKVLIHHDEVVVKVCWGTINQDLNTQFNPSIKHGNNRAYLQTYHNLASGQTGGFAGITYWIGFSCQHVRNCAFYPINRYFKGFSLFDTMMFESKLHQLKI